jgi:pyruvate dehydrogenase E2 component (dihydrolipoamide acetyltransferase)
MPTIVVLPKMGMTMTEGTLAQWLVPDGAPVEKGQPIFRMLTEKINAEVEAETSGILRHLVPEDTTVPAGAVVGCILAQDEELPPELVEMAASAAAPAPAAAAPAPAAPGAARGALPARETGEFVRASPLARRLAEEAGIDLSQVEGTGPGGRILQEDVERAIAARREAPAPAAPPAGRTIPFKGVRRTIGQRMHESLQTMAQLTITMEVDVTEVGRMCQELSERWQAEPGEGVSVTYTHAIVKAAALALAEHPRLNSTLEGDVIRLLDEVNVGVAVSLSAEGGSASGGDEGLIVPVVRQADRKPLRQIAVEARELSEKARQGTLTVDEVTGGTFTVTTLGMYDVDIFTPIVNPPQCAILGVGRVKEVPAFLDDRLVRRSVLNLSLSFDHRVVDGAPAAEFLRRVKHYLEHPDLLLADQ